MLVTNVLSATHGPNALAGLVRFTFNPQTAIKRTQADGNPELLDAVGASARGQAVFNDSASYNAALAGVEANLEIVARVRGGAATRKFTAKNVTFTAASGTLPDLVSQGMAEYTADWIGSGGAADTAATMVTEAVGP